MTQHSPTPQQRKPVPFLLQQEQIRQIEKRFRAAFDQAAIGIALVGIDGRFLEVNQKFCDIVGYPHDVLQGLTFQDITFPDDLKADLAYSQQLLDGQRTTYSMEKRYVRADGSLLWTNLTVSLVRNEQHEPFYFIKVIEDIQLRKQLEAALLRSEARARRLVDSNIIGVVLANEKEILEANDAFLTFMDYTREQLETGCINWREITPPEYLPRDEYALQELQERGTCTPFEKEYIRRDGTRVAVLIGAAVVQNKPLENVVFILDITERKQQEQRLRNALNTLLSIAEVLVTSTQPADAHPYSMQEALEQRLLVPIREALSCAGMIMITLAPATEMIESVVTTGFDSDTTSKMQQRLYGQALTDRFADQSILQNLRAGHIQSLDVSVAPYKDRQPHPSLTRMQIVPMLLHGTLIGIIAIYPAHPDQPFTNEENMLAQAIGRFSALLIERERLYQERKIAVANAQAAQAIAQQMDEFLGIVSHELRTPLTTIKAGIQLAQRYVSRIQPEGDTEQMMHAVNSLTDVLSRAERQIGVQNRLVNDLLDVSRIRANRLELHSTLFNLVQITHDTVEDQRNLLPTRTIHFDTDSSELLVHADAERVGQVVNNYLTNALKYSEPHAPVSVNVAHEHLHEHLYARVSVRDQGPGLSKEQQEHIWDRFYRVPGIEVKSGSGVGLGLGLHICSTLIERQGGQVGVQSTPGHGSIFWFTLPLA